MIPPTQLPMSPVQWTTVPIVTLACFVGLFIMTNLFEVARRRRTLRRTLPDILVPSTTALGLWGVVFSAVQSHFGSEKVSYSIPLTALSMLVLLVPFVGAYMLAVRTEGKRRLMTAVTLSTLLAAFAASAMNISLIAAVQITDMRIRWDLVDIVLAFLPPLAIGLASIAIRIRRTLLRTIVVAALGAAAFTWVHYQAVSSIIIEPYLAPQPMGLSGDFLDQFIITSISLMVLMLTLVSGDYVRVQSYFIRNLESAIEAMPVGLAFYDKHDRLMLWNTRYANLNPAQSAKLKVGMSYREVLESGVKDAIIPQNGLDDGSWTVKRSLEHDEGDWLHPYNSGAGWIQIQKRRTQDKGLVTTVADLTAQMQNRITLENQLTEANSANLAKSRFLANMSHEIRTPLNGVLAVADTLSRTNLTGQQTEMVNMIRQSSQTLQILLTEILDLARMESGQLSITPEPVDLEALINEVIQPHAATAYEKGVSFDISISPSARAWVNADPVRLKQVLGNVLSNAVKFTHEGRISLTVNAHESLFHFIITDTGIGFPKTFRPRLFGRFEQADSAITRNFGGSGLGLAICAELVELMKGSIDADSTEGVGSTFSITLPFTRVASPDRDVTPHMAEEDNSADGGLRILLADDNATNRRVVQLIMETTHARMDEVENGQEAVDAYLGKTYDLILMDMQMPVMDGLSAVRTIRQLEAENGRKRTPIIMLTANAMPEHVSSSLEAGADAHLAKPFNVTQLLELSYKLTASH